MNNDKELFYSIFQGTWKKVYVFNLITYGHQHTNHQFPIGYSMKGFMFRKEDFLSLMCWIFFKLNLYISYFKHIELFQHIGVVL